MLASPEKSSAQDTIFYQKQTLNCRGRLLDISVPQVMAILNVTPDSFFDGGHLSSIENVVNEAVAATTAGATILDVGGYSTRPGAAEVTESEELSRVIPAISAIIEALPEAIVSVDTFRAQVARKAIEAGASIINDVSAGSLDEKMFASVADLQVPYVLMHMQGTPQTMQNDPEYVDLHKEIALFFAKKIQQLHDLGVNDIVLDPGFGFGKTVEHNYQLLQQLEQLHFHGLPILAGFSRKSMINKVLGTIPETALNGTSILNTIALEKGASILRVHDVKEAIECVRIVHYLKNV